MGSWIHGGALATPFILIVSATLGGCTGDIVGDGIRGGLLYDTWWKVTDDAVPATDHPLWAERPDIKSNTRSGADSWRCKECHGWDYEGVDGAYGSGSHRTGIMGVLATTMKASKVKDLLADPDGHAYVLDDQDLNDLAVFVTEWTVSASAFIDDSGKFKGTASSGQSHFDNVCVECHGADGLNQEPTGSDGGFEDYPGLIANDNPQEFLHKVRFGQPGTLMPGQADQLSDLELAHLGAHCQDLPQEI